jgi:hypothetical protein
MMVIRFKKSVTAILPAAVLLLSIIHPTAQAQVSIPSQIIKSDEDLPNVDFSLKTAYQEVTVDKSIGVPVDSPVFDSLQINWSEESVLTLVGLNTEASLLRSDIEAIGGSVVACGPYACTCWIPIASIPAVSELPSVNFLRAEMMSRNQKGARNNEAFVAHRVDDVRNLISSSLTGAGLKIGVLSDSYDTSTSAVNNAADDIASGDLPNDVIVLQDLPAARNPSDEGRAMLQLIHDIAPDAKLYFRTAFLGAQDFANGIKELADAGCNVIVGTCFFAQVQLFLIYHVNFTVHR